MIKIAFMSQTLTPMGGGAKDVAMTVKHLDRRIFEPFVLSETPSLPWCQEYGIGPSISKVFSFHDEELLGRTLSGTDVVYLMVGTANEPSEYAHVWRAAANAKVKLRVLRIVFGLGNASPDKADLFLLSSRDSYLVGTPCDGCHVIHPPLPRYAAGGTKEFYRTSLGISQRAFVVGYACADHRPEFYQVADTFNGTEVVFLSALSKPEGYSVPPNVRFMGVLRQSEMPSLYETCDVILHTRTESFGYSPYQAMMAERPVIALWTNSRNAFAEAMYPGGGYLASGVQGLIQALRHVWNHPEEAASRAAVAKTRALLFVPEHAVRRFESLVLEALRQKGHCPEEFRNVYPQPSFYVTLEDIEAWKSRKAEIERELSRKPFI